MVDFHLKKKIRSMQLWMNEAATVIVATNAFGMGIDKANVKPYSTARKFRKLLPRSWSSRTKWRKAFAILLTSPSDIIQAENQFINILPDKSFEPHVCQALQLLSNCIRRRHQRVYFNLHHFCLKYGFPTLKPTMPCNFWIDKELLICPKNFLKKSPCNFLFLPK
jgi:ATP-dependent DNA helicase RecQ